MSRRAALAALVAAGLLAATPLVASLPSLALFTDSVTATGNSVTAAPCASTTTWSTRAAALDTGGTNRAWLRMSGSGGFDADAYTGASWSDSSIGFGTSGALYCSTDPAATFNGAADRATSTSRTYATWGANGTGTMLLWVRGTSASAGRLVSLAEAASGGSAYAERVLWVTATGGLVFGGRFGSNTSNAFTTTTSGIAINDGRWHLIAVVMPNTGTTNSAPSIYVDGVLADATTSGTVTYRARSSSSSSASWYVGDNDAGRSPTGAPTSAWVGDYDEFVWVTGSLSATLLGTSDASLFAASDR